VLNDAGTTRSALPGSQASKAFVASSFLLVSAIVALILWHFHDRFWYPADEGNYANVAQRVLSGEVLNAQIQDLHPGYGTFVNAAAFSVFGVDLLSLRYPLIAAAFLQSCAAFALLARRSLLFASLGALATVALGVVQFLDPTPNWYCLSLAFALAYWMTVVPRTGPLRLIGAGFWTGLICLFRQLSGVWIAMAVLVVALIERSEAGERRSLLARALLAVMLLLMLAFVVLSRQGEPGAVGLFVLWPAAILVLALTRVSASDRQAAGALLQLATGAAIAATPLVAYCLAHHSAAAWFDDNVVAAVHLDRFVTVSGPWLAALPIAAAYQAVDSFEPVKIANGIYWAVLPLLATVNGLLIIKRLRRAVDVSNLILPVLAGFYSLGVLFLQDAIYLYFTVGLTLTAVLWLTASSPPVVRATWAGITVLLILVALTCHAGQPYTRTNEEALQGRRTTTVVVNTGIARCSLRLDPLEIDPYRRLVAMIQESVPEGESIAAFPSDAELYFLTGRRNPFRFYNSAVGVRTPADVDDAVELIEGAAPRVITYRPADKYNTEASRAILERVRSRYDRVDTIGGVEVYRLKRGA
jgi:hypothetical protein